MAQRAAVAAEGSDLRLRIRAPGIQLEGMRDQFLPECIFRGRENRKLQFVILCAAALRGGTGSAGVRLCGDRPATSGNTHCSQPSPAFAPPPEPVSRFRRHVGN
jgi:hypothetical protein